MSDIIFDITAIQPFVAEVSGPKVVSGTSGTYTAISANMTSTIVINLDGHGGSTLSTPDLQLFNPQAVVIRPGIEDEPSDPYICCEVRNNCGTNITVAIANNTSFFAAPQGLSDGGIAYFLIQNPVTDTMLTTVPCPSIDQLYGLSDKRLQSIDEITGTYTSVPPNNEANITSAQALAFNCNNDVLYGLSSPDLYRVNLATNFWTIVGDSGLTDLQDITYDSDSNLLFGHSATNGLHTINTITGVWTHFGTSGISGHFFSGLCYNCRNKLLYGTTLTFEGIPFFHSISTIDGRYTSITPLIPVIRFLEYDSVNDIFYGTSTSTIYTLDYDGNVTTLGPVGNPGGGIVLVRSKCCICVAEGTEVMRENGSVLIENLTSGSFVKDYCGHLVEIVDVVENHKKSRDFVCILKHAFGKNKPSSKILIKRGHPLLIGNREIPCEELVDGKMIKEIRTKNAKKIYTIVTEKRTFIKMNNMNVGTWSENDFENFCQENVDFRFSLKK